MLHRTFLSLGWAYLLTGAVATWVALRYQLPAAWLLVRPPEALATDIWWWGTRLSPPLPMLFGFAVALWMARPRAERGQRAALAAATLFGLAFSMGGAGEPLLQRPEQPDEPLAAALLLLLQAAILAVPPAFTSLGIVLLARRYP
jgi:hypothetical protein